MSRLLLLDTIPEQLGTYGRAASPVLSPESATRRTELLSGDTVKLTFNKYIPAVLKAHANLTSTNLTQAGSQMVNVSEGNAGLSALPPYANSLMAGKSSRRILCAIANSSYGVIH